jgi:hypothetical protein
VPVAGIPTIPPDHVVASVAEVTGDLAFQGGLNQPLGQLREQPALAGQRQPAGAGPAGQLRDQLLIHRVQARRRQRRLAAGKHVQVHGRFGRHFGHRVHTP